MSENETSILKNVQIAIANNGGSLTGHDAGAVAVLYRLSILLDVKFDAGDTSDLAQLIARHAGLMDALLLTPKSRNVGLTPVVQETDHGKDFAETYLRLIKTPDTIKPVKRSKPRASGSATSGKPEPAVDGLAKARHGSSVSGGSGRKVD
jgi:hypothetical protein